MNIVATNKKAYHDYFVVETLECGINLIGCEVKSIRAGNINLKDNYCVIDNGNIIVKSIYIAPYDKGSYNNLDSRRDRRLLAKSHEIDRILGKVKEKGYTLVITKMYFVGSLVKVELALVKGKQNYDKRQTIADKDISRDTARQIANYTKR